MTRAIPLYRSLLRAHRQYLSAEERYLGDSYVKAEFRLHKRAEEQQLGSFFAAWEHYLQHIVSTGERRKNQAALASAGSLGANAVAANSDSFQFGQDLPQDTNLSDEQRLQLEKLKAEAAKLSKESTDIKQS